MVVFIQIAYTDWQTKRIPDKQILFVLLLGVANIWMVPERDVWQQIIGIFTVSVPLILLAGIVPGSIGGGDIKLLAAGGFLLGAERIWNSFCIGVVLSGIFVVGLLVTQKVTWKTEIALGPFLCIGMMLVFCGI